MTKRAAFVASLTVLFHPGPAQAAEPRTLAPSSDWTLDFADERCSLIREFADGDDRIRLQLDTYGPTGRGFGVMISGDLVPGASGSPMRKFRVSYSPDTRERQQFLVAIGRFDRENAVSYSAGFLPDELLAINSPGWLQATDGPESAFQRSITHITVEFDRREPFRLDTGSMAAPMVALRQCVDNLIASWGIDPAEYRTNSQQAQLVGTSQSWTKVEPADQRDSKRWNERHMKKLLATRPAGRGASPVRVMLDAAGQPTACVLQVPSPSEAYEQAVCELLSDIAYHPALDAEGRPVASFIQVVM